MKVKLLKLKMIKLIKDKKNFNIKYNKFIKY